MSGTVSNTIAGEGSLLFLSFLFGIALMLLYDVLRVFRRMIKHGTIFMAVEDVFYWALCAVGIFAMLYQENDGLLRWFVLVGVAVGMLLENSLISPFVVRVFVRIFGTLQKIIGKILRVLTRPLKKVFIFFRKQLKKVKKAIKIGLSKE